MMQLLVFCVIAASIPSQSPTSLTQTSVKADIPAGIPAGADVDMEAVSNMFGFVGHRLLHCVNCTRLR